MRRYFAIAALLVVAASGSTAALAGASDAPYLGTWTARLSLDYMYDHGFDPRMAGKYRLVLRKNGSYTYLHSWGPTPQHGRYVTSKRKIVFSKDTGCAEANLFGEGVYTWSIVRNRLRFAPVGSPSNDPCSGRWEFLTYPVWTRR